MNDIVRSRTGWQIDEWLASHSTQGNSAAKPGSSDNLARAAGELPEAEA